MNNKKTHHKNEIVESIKHRIQKALNNTELTSLDKVNFEYYPTTDTLAASSKPSMGGLLHFSIATKHLLKINQGQLVIDDEYLNDLYAKEVYDIQKDRNGRILENRFRIIELDIANDIKRAILENTKDKDMVLAFPFKKSFPAYFNPKENAIKHVTPYLFISTHSGASIEVMRIDDQPVSDLPVFAFEWQDGVFNDLRSRKALLKDMPDGQISPEILPSELKNTNFHLPEGLPGATVRPRDVRIKSISRNDSLHLSNMSLCLATLSSIALSSSSTTGIDNNAMGDLVCDSREDIEAERERIRPGIFPTSTRSQTNTNVVKEKEPDCSIEDLEP